MSRGYDSFFKAAKEARGQKVAPTGEKIKSAKSKPAKKKDLSEFTERELRAIFKVKPEKAPRQRAPFPIAAVSILALGFALLGWWIVDEKMPQRLLAYSPLNWLEIQAVTGAQAETKSAPKPAPTSAPASALKDAQAAEESRSASEPETLAHLSKLKERNESLDRREKELGELEEELLKQKAEVEKRIQQLEELRSQIATVLKDRVEADQAKVGKLVETYSNMRPKQAAEVLAGMDEDLAIEILGQMKKKNAAEIMNLLEPAKARSFSEKFAGYKRN